MRALVNWFIPEDLLKDRTSALQSRAMVTVMLVGLSFVPTFMFLEHKMGIEGLLADNLFIAVAFVLCLVAMKLTGAFYVIRHVFLLVMLGFFVHLSLVTGRLTSFQAIWTLVFPLIAFFVCGRREGLVWAGIDAACIVLMGTVNVETLGIVPVVLSPEAQAQQVFSGYLGAALVISLLAYLFESSKEAGYGQLEIERQQAEALARQVKQLLGDVTSALIAADREGTAIASNAQRIAGSMVEQVKQVNEVSDTMTALHQRVVRNAEDSVKAAADAGTTGERAAMSGMVMTEAIQDMREVSDRVGAAAVKIEELTRRSDEIGNIVGVIREIADQTNLLALNAAIEAARAGEQGRGFAVVADEVRKLAERTQSSTGEIGQRVSNILSVTQEAMQSMREATQLMLHSRDNAARADEALQDIIHRSESVAGVLRELAATGMTQTEANARMTKQVDSIRTAIDDAYNSMAEIAEGTRRLEHEIRTLSETANAFGAKG